MPSLLPSVSLLIVEANVFSGDLDDTVGTLFGMAIAAIGDRYTRNLEDYIGGIPDQEISEDRLYDLFADLRTMQVRSLSVMAFALMEAQLIGFLKDVLRKELLVKKDVLRKELLKELVREDVVRKEQEVLRIEQVIKALDRANREKLVAFYSEFCKIDIKNLQGYQECEELILARNCCIHNHQKPSPAYKAMPAPRFVIDGFVALDAQRLKLAITDLKTFVHALVGAVAAEASKR